MDKVLINFFKNNNLKFKNKTFVLAISTGVDSMVMLQAFLNLKDKFALKLHVAHYNHRMRMQSEVEEEFLKEYCLKNDISCNVESLQEDATGNFQSFARTKRYEFFYKVCASLQADYLVLAHHADDNIETILMRIIRGSNLKGYSGMDEVVPFHNSLLIRPFLRTAKSELINYANLHKLKYYQDESNFDDIYTRNRIRKEIVPVLYNEDQNVYLKFQDFSETLKEANKLLEEKVNNFLNITIKGGNYVNFSLLEFLKLNNFLRIEVLFKLLKEYELSKSAIEEILKLILSTKKNLKVHFKNQFTFVKEYNKISFYRGLIETPKFDVLIIGPGTYQLSDKISVNVIKKDSIDIPNYADLWYNTNMLPIRLRNRKPGDKILIETGYKKVKDLLIDKKIGILEREQVIICEKDKEILAVLGIRKSSVLKQMKNNDIIIKVERKDG
ncbi:MAG: tRNA lysidine(34) synthetase TilS [Bacilli bacterium]|jgi:tRNA(Ile)-lysidine synthetase-like protein